MSLALKVPSLHRWTTREVPDSSVLKISYKGYLGEGYIANLNIDWVSDNTVSLVTQWYVLRGLSLVAVSRGYSLLWCAGFRLQRLLLLEPRLWGTQASVVVAPGL